MERLEIALDEFRQAMDAEGLTPRQQVAIYDQVANIIRLVHDESWGEAIRSIHRFSDELRGGQ